MDESPVQFRPQPLRSWLDPASSRKLAVELNEKLIAKFKNKRGLFITLSYRRDDYKNALDLYRVQREERHVRKFIERLSVALDTSLTGKWCRKMEFQMKNGREGWVHFHIALDYPGRIPHALLERCWRHGFVWVNEITPKRLHYFAKYMAKPDDVPAYLYNERPRSIKVVAVSPGFWGTSDAKPSKKYGKRAPHCIFVPIGERLRLNKDRVVLRDVHTGDVRSFAISMATAITLLIDDGKQVKDAGASYKSVFAPFDEVAALFGEAERSAAATAAAERLPLHLTTLSNPPPWQMMYLEDIGAIYWERVAA